MAGPGASALRQSLILSHGPHVVSRTVIQHNVWCRGARTVLVWPVRIWPGDEMENRRIKITAAQVSVTAVLDNSRTADLVWDALPIQASGSIWGDEIYFRTSVQAEEEDAKEVVDLGDVGYWPPGQALCLFFGPTPASRGDEIRPASPVNVLGKIDGDPTVLKSVRPGSPVVVEKG